MELLYYIEFILIVSSFVSYQSLRNSFDVNLSQHTIIISLLCAKVKTIRSK